MSSSLTAKRAEFLQRQEKVQARNISDAAARYKTSRKYRTDEKSYLPNPLESTNWLNNKDKLQAILDVQKLPLGAKMKKVIEFLREVSHPVFFAVQVTNYTGTCSLCTSDIRRNLQQRHIA